jgi:pyruvate dehydrogenase E2 component (dihydrolipoamide acetyltransferase)
MLTLCLGEPGEDFQALLSGDALLEKHQKNRKKKAEEVGPSSASTVTPEELGCTVITMPLLSDTHERGCH